MKVRPVVLGLAVALFLPLAAYGATLAPTLYTFDSAEFAAGAYSLGIVHSTGYPLYLLLGKLFTFLPVGDPAYRVNLMSAVWGSVTTGVLYLICYRVTERPSLSVVAALLYAFSRFVWETSVVAEVYTLNTALVGLLILLLFWQVERPAVWNTLLAGLGLGLSLANHMSTILMIPALIYWQASCRNGLKTFFEHLAALGAATCAGLLVYLYLPVRYASDPPLNYAKAYFDCDLTTLGGFFYWVSGAMFRPLAFSYDLAASSGEVLTYLSWLWSSYLGLGVIVGLAGIIVMFRTRRRWSVFLLCVFAAYTVFFVNYSVPDKDTMFNVSYLVWAIWLAFGARAIGDRLSVSEFGKLAHYLWLSLLALLAFASFLISLPVADQSRDYAMAASSKQLLDSVDPSAVVVTEWERATPLEYYQIVERMRPDVQIFDRGLYALALWSRFRAQNIPDQDAFLEIEIRLQDKIQTDWSPRPVYATQYDPWLEQQFLFIPQGNYYRLELRPGRGNPP